jgi:hypothetical protein
MATRIAASAKAESEALLAASGLLPFTKVTEIAHGDLRHDRIYEVTTAAMRSVFYAEDLCPPAALCGPGRFRITVEFTPTPETTGKTT